MYFTLTQDHFESFLVAIWQCDIEVCIGLGWMTIDPNVHGPHYVIRFVLNHWLGWRVHGSCDIGFKQKTIFNILSFQTLWSQIFLEIAYTCTLNIVIRSILDHWLGRWGLSCRDISCNKVQRLFLLTIFHFVDLSKLTTATILFSLQLLQVRYW